MSLLNKAALASLVLLLSLNGYSQIKALATPSPVLARKTADTVPTVKPASKAATLVLQPQRTTKVLQHTQVLKNTLGGVAIKAVPMAVYGNDANFKAARLVKFNALSTEPSFTKNIGGINVHYKLKKNPDYDNPPTASTQPAGSTTDASFNCTTSRESVSARSSSFMSVSANGSGIYPGAIYEYNDFYSGNVLRTVGDGKRNPINIYTTNLANSSGDVAVQVTNPAASTISAAVAPIVRNFSKTTASASSQGQYTYSNNSAAMALNISAGGSYSGFSATAGFSINKQDKHIYITCDYKIPLYALSTEIPENGFFTDPAIESTPNLLLISSVMYGTRILANIDVDESSLSDSAFAIFQFGDPSKSGAKAAFDYLKTEKSQKITINTYTVGNLPQVSPHPNSIDELLSQVDAVIRSVTYQTAMPIGYTLTDMAGNTIGVESATDTYVVKNCVPKAAEYRLVSAKVDIQTGADSKDNGSNVNLLLYSNGGFLAGEQNANTEFPANATSSVALNVRSVNASLMSYFQKGNNYLQIKLNPKQVFLGFDGWDVKSVTLTLHFEDQNGNPAANAPQITMNNSQVRLEKDHQTIKCYFNNRFESTTTMQSN